MFKLLHLVQEKKNMLILHFFVPSQKTQIFLFHLMGDFIKKKFNFDINLDEYAYRFFCHKKSKTK